MKMQFLLANKFELNLCETLRKKEIIVNNLNISKSSHKVLTSIISFSNKCYSKYHNLKQKEPEYSVSF